MAVLTVVCAWCGAVLREGNETVSHGICDHCSWQVESRLLRDLSRAYAPRARQRRLAVLAGAPLPGFEN